MEYEMRALQATDIFPVLTIISKLGINNVKELVDNGTIEDIISQFKNKGGKDKNVPFDVQKIGISLFLQLGDIVLSNIEKCKDDIFEFLASLCGVEPDELRESDLSTFAVLIVQFIQKDELRDFIKVVLKSLNLE